MSNNALREMLASAMERADKEALDEALAAPQATASVRRSRLHGTGIVASTAAIITLSFWGFTYFQSQQSSAPRVQQETVQSKKNEVGTVGNTTTTEENTSRSTDTQYNAQQTDQFLQPPFAAISHTTRPQTNSSVTTTVADTITKNNTTQTEPYPADSLLPEDFRSWEMPSYLAWAVAQRRYGTARTIIDSMLHNGQHSAQSEYNLYCLRGHLSKAMDSVEASIADYSQALSFQESSALYMQRGTQYFTASKRQEAYDDFTSAMRLDPKNYQAVYMRGAAAYNLKRFEEACDDWSLAAQMGHPFADSIMEVKCSGYMPKYARTAIADKKKHIKDMMFLAERAKEGFLRLPFGYSMAQQQYRFDFQSYKSLSPRCTLESALSGSATTYCVLHVFYTYLLEMSDDMLLLQARQLAEQTQMAWSTAWTSPESARASSQPMRDDVSKQIFDLVAKNKNMESLPSLISRQTATTMSSVANSATPSSEHNGSIHKRLLKTVEDIQTYLRDNYTEFIEK